VDIVDISVAVVINTRPTVQLSLVRPELIPKFLVIYVSAVVEHRNDDGLLAGSVCPREGARYVVKPPQIPCSVCAVVGARFIDREGGNQRGTAQRLARKSCLGCR